MSIQSLMNDRFARVPLTRKELGEFFQMDWELVEDSMIAQLAWHGAKQKANDGLGDKDFTNSERIGLFRKACDNIQNNIWGASRESDPVEREAKTIARGLANKWAAKELPNVKAVDLAKDAKYRAKYEAFLGNAKVREMAEARVAELAELEL